MLKFKRVKIKSGDLGADSLIPDIHNSSADPFFICDQSVPEEQKSRIGKGLVKTILPYKMQNLYNRDIKYRKYTAAVLENDHLIATFLPELGGRLWSLYDKKLKKDIVYENDAIIYANLALCNAWFVGGVEWNIGMKGHSPFTCRKMFSKKAVNKQGQDVLVMYEYEEKRKLVFSINATLIEDKLIVQIEVENVSNEKSLMYWWSNIATEQTADTRIFVPANKSFITDYREGGYKISRKNIPIVNGVDTSYAIVAPEAIDYFYDIEDDKNKWIACLEKDGTGLLHCSSNTLKGRKTFLWGQNNGGRHWNEWLTVGRDYLEIQAGICKTQFEHFEFSAGEKLIWNEIYKGIDIKSNEGDFADVSSKIDMLYENADEYSYAFDIVKQFPLQTYGSGKGYIVSLFSGKNISEKYEFSIKSVDKSQRYYLDLFNGKRSKINVETDFICDKNTISFIENLKDKTWFEYYNLAIGNFANEDFDLAYKNLLLSIERERHYLPLTALALYEVNIKEDYQKGFELINEAVLQRPDYVPLVNVYGEICIKAQKYTEFCSFFENSCSLIKNTGRVKMYAAQCYCMIDDVATAEIYLNEELIVPDVREGEYSVSNIWVQIHKRKLAKETSKNIDEISDKEVLQKYPVPYKIDFRMH